MDEKSEGDSESYAEYRGDVFARKSIGGVTVACKRKKMRNEESFANHENTEPDQGARFPWMRMKSVIE